MKVQGIVTPTQMVLKLAAHFREAGEKACLQWTDREYIRKACAVLDLEPETEHELDRMVRRLEGRESRVFSFKADIRLLARDHTDAILTLTNHLVANVEGRDSDLIYRGEIVLKPVEEAVDIKEPEGSDEDGE